jgi:plasmid stabilization system protein ParE
MKARIHPEAEREYQEARAWYSARSQQAGIHFETAFEQAIESIEANPVLYGLWEEVYRFCKMRRFPYSLIYRIEGEEVQVVAVAHGRRLPGYWGRRA